MLYWLSGQRAGGARAGGFRDALANGVVVQLPSVSSVYDLGCMEQLLGRNVKRFRGGLVFKAHRRMYHSTLGLRVINQKNKKNSRLESNK